MIRALGKRFFGLLGKSDRRIIVVFAASSEAWRDAVAYLRREAPQFPVWLVASRPIDPAVARDCERILAFEPGPLLPARVAGALWPHWVVLSVVTCTAESGFPWMKLAPLLVPPWKLLLMNEHRDFFAGLPFGLLVHGLRRLRDSAATAAVSLGDLLLGVFWKIAWVLLDPVLSLTSQPWLQPQERPPLTDPVPLPAEPLVRFPPSLTVPEPLRALFNRPDTFAAGFQPGRAEFQKDVLPRAAFRVLQPGEASAVLAPVAEETLVDAAKLARLGGFPPAWTRRCQWLLLHWKAARAGWKSYSVGGVAGRLPMIPDRAFAELEFCLRLLWQRPRPGPAAGSFDDRRGSIALHPRFQSPLNPGRRRILIASPYLPFPLSHGGAVRIWNLSQQLCREFDLLLVTFRERQDQVDYERLASCFARVLVVDHDERHHPDHTVPAVVAQFRSRAMAAALRQAAAEFQPDLLQIEYTQLAAYRDVLPQLPAVLVEHDVTFSLYEQIWQAEQTSRARAEYDLWHRFESHWLGRYDAVALMSAPERDRAVAAGAPDTRAWIVPNGVDTVRFEPSDAPPDPLPELLFVGSFRHRPNLLGFRHLEKEILPRLWRNFGDLRLRVVAGPEYEKYWKAPVDSRITVEGFVADLAPRYARAGVVLVPLVVSAGTNIKVMEALACGRPVVSTPIGCAGLDLVDGREALIADGPEAFAAAVDRLLRDPGLRRRLGRQARQAAVDRFSWEQAARRAVEMYRSLLPDL